MADAADLRPRGASATIMSLPLRLLTDWRYFSVLSVLVLVAEAVFGAVIITRVACAYSTAAVWWLLRASVGARACSCWCL